MQAVIGLVFCAGVPALCFAAGAFWHAHGSPVHISFGFRRRHDAAPDSDFDA